MIMGSCRKYEIGSRGVGLIDDEKTSRPDQPFVVLREATEEEWITAGIEKGRSRNELLLMLADVPHAYFYEVSVD